MDTESLFDRLLGLGTAEAVHWLRSLDLEFSVARTASPRAIDGSSSERVVRVRLTDDGRLQILVAPEVPSRVEARPSQI